LTYWRHLVLLLLFITACLFLTTCSQENEQKKLNVYNWYNVISPSILEEFEKEFGIKIVYDVYDSNDVLEAKILSGNSGYDVVFPSSYPYLARQLESKVYAKLDRVKIPNLKLIDSELTGLLDKIPEGRNYAVPYMWGITVIGYRADLIEKILPHAPLHSLKMLYDIEVVKKVSKCGISYLEEPIDVIPLALHYLGYPHHSAKRKIFNGL
jgi:putrescine transport system substrate-binding protein